MEEYEGPMVDLLYSHSPTDTGVSWYSVLGADFRKIRQ